MCLSPGVIYEEPVFWMGNQPAISAETLSPPFSQLSAALISFWLCCFCREAERGDASSIWCRWKAKILVITPPPLVPSQLPFYLILFLQSRACSSVGISVSSSSEQGSGPCQSHYITRPRYCGSAWPGWRDDHRGFVFSTFPFSSPVLLLLLPQRQTAYWCCIEGACSQETGKALWPGVRRNMLLASWMAWSSHLRQRNFGSAVGHSIPETWEPGERSYCLLMVFTSGYEFILCQISQGWQAVGQCEKVLAEFVCFFCFLCPYPQSLPHPPPHLVPWHC